MMRTALTLWSAATFAALWLGFVIVLADDGREFESLDKWIEGRPVPVRVGLWVLFLPMVVGVKSWTSSSTTVRAIGLAALLIWTAVSAASLARLLTN